MSAHFQAGGSLRQEAIYVQRPADRELRAALRRGDYCHVLAPRQIGKSSLRARTAQALRLEGVRSASLDLNRIGSRDTPSDWYFSVVDVLARQLELPDAEPWWRASRGRTPQYRFTRYVREEVLERIDGRVVIFIDEIDDLLTLPQQARDDFFAALRALYNARADDGAYARLSLCLLGAAMPHDLIHHESRTPFNIGRAIPLYDFSREEMTVLGEGLAGVCRDAALALDEIFAWTAGHPYMTQRICQELTEHPGASVAALVERVFGRRGHILEASLGAPERCFVRAESGPRVAKMLRLYERLLSGEQIAAQGSDLVQLALRMTGLAAERREESETMLRLRNRIFAEVYNGQWVRERQAGRRITDSMHHWLESGRRPAFLLRGEDLAKACEWSAGREDVTEDERGYLLASQQRERDVARRWLAAVVGIAALLISMAAWEVHAQHRRARQAEWARQGMQTAALALSATTRASALQVGLQAAESSLAYAPIPPQPILSALTTSASRVVRFRPLATRGGITRVASLSPDGRYAAIVDQAGLCVWDLGETENTAVRVVWCAPESDSLDTSALSALAFSADGARLLGGQGEKRVYIWDTRSGQLLRSLIQPAPSTFPSAAPMGAVPCRSHIGSVSFSLDGTRVITADWDGSARIWDAQSGQPVRAFFSREGGLESAALSPDGSLLVTGGADTNGQIWDVHTGERRQVLLGGASSINAVAFSPDGTRVATAAEDKSARIWDARTGALLLTLLGHEDDVLSLAFSHDGESLITGSADRTARIWDLRNGTEKLALVGHPGSVNTVAISASGERVLTTTWLGTTRIWNVKQGRIFVALEEQAGNRRSDVGWATATAFSPDGGWVMTAGQDHIARVWDAATGALKTKIAAPGMWIQAAALSADGRFIYAGLDDTTVRVWDAATGDLVRTLRGHRGPVLTVATSANGQLLATASADDAHVHIWAAHSFAERAPLAGIADTMVTALAFSPQAERLLSGHRDGTTVQWDLRTGTPESVLHSQGEQGAVMAVAFSPLGTLVATASEDGKARLWDPHRGKLLRVLDQHRRAIGALFFSPDGSRIMTASWDGTVVVWDVRSGEPLWTFSEYGAPIYAAALSRDGERMVVAGASSRALIVPARWQSYLRFAQSFRGDLEAERQRAKPREQRLGSLDIVKACLWQEGPAAAVILKRPPYSPAASWSWICMNRGYECSLDLAPYCQHAHGAKRALARPTEFDDAYSWYCYLPEAKSP